MTAPEKKDNQQGCEITLGTVYFASELSRESVFHFSISPNPGFFLTVFSFCGWLLDMRVKRNFETQYTVTFPKPASGSELFTFLGQGRGREKNN